MDLKTPQIVRTLRKAYGLTQVEMSNRLGITQGTLSKIEAGNLAMTLEQFINFHNKFDVKLEYIQSGFIHSNPDLYDLKNSKFKGVGGITKKTKYTSRHLITLKKLCGMSEDYFRDKIESLKIDQDLFFVLNFPVSKDLVLRVASSIPLLEKTSLENLKELLGDDLKYLVGGEDKIESVKRFIKRCSKYLVAKITIFNEGANFIELNVSSPLPILQKSVVSMLESLGFDGSINLSGSDTRILINV